MRVRVELLGELAIGAAKLLVGRLVRDPECLVVVGRVPIPLGCHGSAPQPPTKTIAGRSTFDFNRYPARMTWTTVGPSSWAAALAALAALADLTGLTVVVPARCVFDQVQPVAAGKGARPRRRGSWGRTARPRRRSVRRPRGRGCREAASRSARGLCPSRSVRPGWRHVRSRGRARPAREAAARTVPRWRAPSRSVCWRMERFRKLSKSACSRRSASRYSSRSAATRASAAWDSKLGLSLGGYRFPSPRSRSSGRSSCSARSLSSPAGASWSRMPRRCSPSPPARSRPRPAATSDRLLRGSRSRRARVVDDLGVDDLVVGRPARAARAPRAA